jgi:hypothetical protein
MRPNIGNTERAEREKQSKQKDERNEYSRETAPRPKAHAMPAEALALGTEGVCGVGVSAFLAVKVETRLW